MANNLTNLYISSSFQRILQVSETDNTTLLNGTGSAPIITMSGSFSGDGSGLTGVTAAASSIPWTNVTSKPTVFSSSYQVTYPEIQNIPNGIVSGSSQITYTGITNIPSGIISGSVIRPSDTSSMTVLSSSNALTASYLVGDTGEWNGQYTGSAGITGSLTISGSLIIDPLEPTVIRTPGQMYWNDVDQTVTLDLAGDDVSLQIGQEILIYALNDSGLTISNGDAVRISGASGNKVTIDLVSSNPGGILPHSENEIIGLATEEIANNNFGYVTTFGAVRDLNTSSFPEGSVLYLSTTDGEVTNNLPPAPNDAIQVGIVQRSHATQGEIFVQPKTSIHFSEIVTVTGSNIPSGNSYLTFDSSSGITSFTDSLTGSFSGSFVGDGSQLTNLSVGGQGIFNPTSSYYSTTNDLQITGSFKVSSYIETGVRYYANSNISTSWLMDISDSNNWYGGNNTGLLLSGGWGNGVNSGSYVELTGKLSKYALYDDTNLKTLSIELATSRSFYEIYQGWDNAGKVIHIADNTTLVNSSDVSITSASLFLNAENSRFNVGVRNSAIIAATGVTASANYTLYTNNIHNSNTIYANNFSGSGTNIIGVVTSSYALTAGVVDSIPWGDVTSKPEGIVSSSIQTLTNIAGGTVPGNLNVTGDVIITGDITATEFHTIFTSASIIYESGSTKFGDTQDDNHNFTGSLNVSGSINVTGPITGLNFTGSFSGSIANTLQEVTDNGNSTTNQITASRIALSGSSTAVLTDENGTGALFFSHGGDPNTTLVSNDGNGGDYSRSWLGLYSSSSWLGYGVEGGNGTNIQMGHLDVNGTPTPYILGYLSGSYGWIEGGFFDSVATSNNIDQPVFSYSARNVGTSGSLYRNSLVLGGNWSGSSVDKSNTAFANELRFNSALNTSVLTDVSNHNLLTFSNYAALSNTSGSVTNEVYLDISQSALTYRDTSDSIGTGYTGFSADNYVLTAGNERRINISYGTSNVYELYSENNINSYTVNTADTKPFVISSRNATVNAGVVNAVIAAGTNLTASVDNTLYTQNFNASGSAQITGSLNVTGSVTADFFNGDGSGLTNIVSSETASLVEYVNVANKPTLLSGSFQIATEISGAFNNVSSSFSTRITANENNITTLTNASSSFASNIILLEASASAIVTDSGSFSTRVSNLESDLTHSGSFSGSFFGDGSALTGIEAGIFVATGSYYSTTNDLQITGSLNVTGSVLVNPEGATDGSGWLDINNNDVVIAYSDFATAGAEIGLNSNNIYLNKSNNSQIKLTDTTTQL